MDNRHEQVIRLAGAEDAETTSLVERLAQEDLLGQLLRREGRATELGLENGRPQLDWVDGVEKALARPDLLAGIEEEAASAVRSGMRHLIWAGMGGSVQTIHALKRLGYLDASGVSVHPLDSTDPAALNRTLREIARLEGVDLGPENAPVMSAEPLRALLRKTMMIAVAMGMTSEEPITHLAWFWDLMAEMEIDQPESHVRVIALEDSFLDRYARDRNVQSFPLMPEGRCNTAGRMSAPVTRVFLWPVAWALTAAALVADPNSRFGGQLLFSVLQRAQSLYQVSHSVSDVDRTAAARTDPFLRLGAFISKETSQFGRNRVLLALAPEWQGLAVWIEQVVEESLGKGGKGFLIFYDQDIATLATNRQDCIVLRICKTGEALPEIGVAIAEAGATPPVLSLTVPVSAVPGVPSGLAEVAAVFNGFEKVVATFAYFQGIVFAGQPAVEAYKRYARELRDGGKSITTPPVTPWQAGRGSLIVHYSSLIKKGLLTPEELEAEVPTGKGSDPAEVVAALLRIARGKGLLGYLDLTYNGEQGAGLKSLFTGVRSGIANGILGVPAKLRTGPADYHSTEQSETDGPAEVTSLRFVCLEHDPVQAGRYTDRFLMAQAYGTWQAMEDASRWVIMITLAKSATALSDLEAFFTRLKDILAR